MKEEEYMKKSVVIMNFTNVYKEEKFASRDSDFAWIDCTHLYGTDCYCDAEGAKNIRRLIAAYPPEGIHFIDSGDYHYLTKFWTDKITEPFSLVVFDHHPDMQPPLFEEMLSCGSWVKDVIDTNPFLRKVLLIGAAEQLVRAVPEPYQQRVHFYSEKTLRHEDFWRAFAAEHIAEPIYISVDKDVLNPRSAATNWDQGTLDLAELERLLGVILQQEKVIGIDICGECSSTLDLFEEEREAALDSLANQQLLALFRGYCKKFVSLRSK